MTPSELEAIGRSLYGEHWKAALAQKLNCHRSTVTRWSHPESHPEHRGVNRLWAKEIRALARRKKIIWTVDSC